MSIILKTQDLQKKYTLGDLEVVALKGVDFEVERGEFVAVMGPSGSGKSTLLHLIGGLELPTEGRITLLDKPLAGLSDDELTLIRRRDIGFIFQSFNLLPTLTAAENIAVLLMLDDKKVKDHEDLIYRLLDLVGLKGRKDHKPNQLSGGEQQRVAIARAFVNHPKIVMADEPTGNLDSKSGANVLDIFRKISKELDTTIIMVTHDPKAASYADRVVFLNDGEIISQIAPPDRRIDVNAVIAAMAELDY
ncbi:MAG: ABC transporter ATP-binding protein [Anaerolineae bacterium]|nr:ABC transporter ATP-binding protein [Anaerolineae bacterium]